MSCECCKCEAEHDAWEQQGIATYLPQYEAERRMGYLYHCPDCLLDARGPVLAEMCRLCPPGRHVACEAHR